MITRIVAACARRPYVVLAAAALTAAGRLRVATLAWRATRSRICPIRSWCWWPNGWGIPRPRSRRR